MMPEARAVSPGNSGKMHVRGEIQVFDSRAGRDRPAPIGEDYDYVHMGGNAWEVTIPGLGTIRGSIVALQLKLSDVNRSLRVKT